MWLWMGDVAYVDVLGEDFDKFIIKDKSDAGDLAYIKKRYDDSYNEKCKFFNF